MVVLCGSAYRNRGVEPLLDAVVAYLPSPLDVPAVRGTHDGTEQERPADPAAPMAGAGVQGATPTADRTADVPAGVLGHATRRGTPCWTRARGRERSASAASCGCGPTGTTALERRGRRRHRRGGRAQAPRAPATTLCAPGAPLLLEPPRRRANRWCSVAVEARRAADTDRLVGALARLVEEDPSLAVRTDPRPDRPVLSGLGELHLEVAVEKLPARARPGGRGRPAAGVRYRETVVRASPGCVLPARQTGRRRRPVRARRDRRGAAGTGGRSRSRSAVVGGRVPREYVQRGRGRLPGRARRGLLGGHPVTGLRVTLTDGPDAHEGLLGDWPSARRAGSPCGEALRACADACCSNRWRRSR